MGKKSSKKRGTRTPPRPKPQRRIPWELILVLAPAGLGVSGVTNAAVSLGLIGLSALLVIVGAVREAREQRGRWLDLRAMVMCICALLVVSAAGYLVVARTDPTLPRFRVEIDQVIALRSDILREPCVLVVASIGNEGADGQAMGIGLSARLGRNGKEVGSKPQEMSEKTLLQLPDGTVTYFREDDLAIAESSPVKRGRVVYGVMLYSFPGVSLGELKDERTTYRLAVRGPGRTTYSRRFPATRIPQSVDDLQHFPGIRMEVTYKRTGKTIKVD